METFVQAGLGFLMLIGFSLIWGIGLYFRVARMQRRRAGKSGQAASAKPSRLVSAVDKLCTKHFKALGKRAGAWADPLILANPHKLLHTAFAFTLLGYFGVFCCAWLVAALPLVAVVGGDLLLRCMEPAALGGGDMPAFAEPHELIVARFQMFALIPTAVGLMAVVRMLWLLVLPSRSVGVDLKHYEAPQLFAMLNRMKPDLNLESVFIDASYNMYVVATSRLLRGKREKLVLGFPALLTLSSAQVQACLAHELGHMEESHLLMKEWILASRQIWVYRMKWWRANAPLLYVLMQLCFGWYIPVFSALAFAVKRMGEYEADAIGGTRVASIEYARSLMSLCVKQTMFQPEVHDAIQQLLGEAEPTEAANIYAAIAEKLNRPSEEAARQNWNKVIAAERDELATHPELVHRLVRMGFLKSADDSAWQSEWLNDLQIEQSAGIELLGSERCRKLGERLTAEWRKKEMSRSASLKPAVALMQRGTANLRAGKLEQAIEDYTKAMELDSEMPEAYINRSTAYLHSNNYEQAVDDATKALELRANYASAYSNRALAYYSLEKFQQSIADADKGIELGADTTKATCYLTRSMSQCALKNYHAALADCRQLLEMKPDDPSGLITEATIYARKRCWKEMLEAAERGLRALPDNQTLLELRASAAANSGDYEAALQYFDELAEKCSDKRLVILNRISVLMETGRLDRALSECNRLIEQKQFDDKAYEMRGMVQRNRGDLAAAIADLGKAIDSTPANSEYHLVRADFAFEADDEELARSDYEAVLPRQFPETDDLLRRALIGTRLGHPEAQRDLDKALAAGLEGAHAHNLYGRILLTSGKAHEALSEFTTALEEHDLHRIRYNRASAFIFLNRAAEALADMDFAIGRLSCNPDYYDRRAQAYALSGNEAAAQADRDTAAKLRAALRPAVGVA